MTDEEQPVINEKLAQKMERRGFPAIAAAIRHPPPSEDLPLEEACPWLVEGGKHVSGVWVPDIPLPWRRKVA